MANCDVHWFQLGGNRSHNFLWEVVKLPADSFTLLHLGKTFFCRSEIDQVPERKSLSLIYPFFLSTPGSSPNKTKTLPFVVFRDLTAKSQSPTQSDAQLAKYMGLELHLIRHRVHQGTGYCFGSWRAWDVDDGYISMDDCSCRIAT